MLSLRVTALPWVTPWKSTPPIQAYIRTDVVLTPGGVDFQGVTQGSAVTRKLNIAYAGRDDWKIHEVINKSPHLETSSS